MSPAHSYLVVLGIVLVARLLTRALIALDGWLCRVMARLQRWWRVRQLLQRQDNLARSRRTRVRAMTKRVRSA